MKPLPALLKQLFPDLFGAYSPKEQLNAFLINCKFKCKMIIWSIKRKKKKKNSSGFANVPLLLHLGSSVRNTSKTCC